jgi:PKD repeat protein|tara:strand:- start:1201 stop:2259 length:1059 start_codon:yes stop_codon:yes gene_type:complete
MRSLPLLVATLVLFSGCLDFLDEEKTNKPPTAIASFVGNGPFEPDEIITFTGKDCTDPEGDTLEYFWDFDVNDGNEDNVRGDISNDGKITHSYNLEGTYTVTLTITDGENTDTATVKVKVEKENTEIRARVITDGDVNSEVNNAEKITYTFSASESISESNIIKYEWDFSYESGDGFQVDEESSEDEISHDFDSGIYTIKVRITNEMGESDEASYSDDVELKINYIYSDTRNIDSGNQEHLLQVYGIPARYIRATLEYESNSVHTKDLDLYIYNNSQERNPDDGDSEYVAVNDTHDNGDIEQVNSIELDYYNSTDRVWFDEVHELGEWGVVVDHERTGTNEYTVKIEVIYWE